MTAWQTGLKPASSLTLSPPPSHTASLPQWRESKTAGDSMVGKGPGSREENGEDGEGGVKPGDYATVAVCYGCVKSYIAASNQCPPLYPENGGLSSKPKNHLTKI